MSSAAALPMLTSGTGLLDSASATPSAGSVTSRGEPAADATPLTPPFWFRCFDTGRLSADLASGAAHAYALGRESPAGFDLMLAVYPDGRGYLWRQLGRGYAG